MIVAARRTPIGSFLGSLKEVTAADLGVAAARAALEGTADEVRENLADVIVGNVLQAGQGMNVGRQIARRSGLGDHVPGLTVNRVCGSGLQPVALAGAGQQVGRAASCSTAFSARA